jgi:hypothetical protein
VGRLAVLPAQTSTSPGGRATSARPLSTVQWYTRTRRQRSGCDLLIDRRLLPGNSRSPVLREILKVGPVPDISLPFGSTTHRLRIRLLGDRLVGHAFHRVSWMAPSLSQRVETTAGLAAPALRLPAQTRQTTSQEEPQQSNSSSRDLEAREERRAPTTRPRVHPGLVRWRNSAT